MGAHTRYLCCRPEWETIPRKSTTPNSEWIFKPRWFCDVLESIYLLCVVERPEGHLSWDLFWSSPFSCSMEFGRNNPRNFLKTSDFRLESKIWLGYICFRLWERMLDADLRRGLFNNLFHGFESPSGILHHKFGNLWMCLATNVRLLTTSSHYVIINCKI